MPKQARVLSAEKLWDLSRAPVNCLTRLVRTGLPVGPLSGLRGYSNGAGDLAAVAPKTQKHQDSLVHVDKCGWYPTLFGGSRESDSRCGVVVARHAGCKNGSLLQNLLTFSDAACLVDERLSSRLGAGNLVLF